MLEGGFALEVFLLLCSTPLQPHLQCNIRHRAEKLTQTQHFV